LGVAYICLLKIIHIGLLVVTNISLQYNSTVTFLPDWNPVIELTITKCTTDTDTVHSSDTAHTQLLQNWMEYGYKKESQDYGQVQYNYCNTQMSEIDLSELF